MIPHSLPRCYKVKRIGSGFAVCERKKGHKPPCRSRRVHPVPLKQVSWSS